MLEKCCKCFTNMLQRCCKDIVKMCYDMLQRYYQDITKMMQRCYKDVTYVLLMLQRCYTNFTYLAIICTLTCFRGITIATLVVIVVATIYDGFFRKCLLRKQVCFPVYMFITISTFV